MFATILAKCFSTTFKVRCYFMWHGLSIHCPFSLAAGTNAITLLPVCCESGSLHFSQCSLQLICIRFYWPYLNKILEMVSFSSHTSRKHFVLYERQYNSNVFYFFLRNYYYKYNEIYIDHGYILYKVEIDSPTKLPLLSTHFFNICVRLCYAMLVL